MADITLLTSQGGIKRWRGRADGQALVEATTRPAEESAADDGDAYVFHGLCRTAAAAAGILMYVKNTSAVNEIHIGRIYLDPYTLTDGDLLVTQWITPTTITSGTDVTTTGVRTEEYLQGERTGIDGRDVENLRRQRGHDLHRRHEIS